MISIADSITKLKCVNVAKSIIYKMLQTKLLLSGKQSNKAIEQQKSNSQQDFGSLLKCESKKKSWRKEEDERLLEIVHKQGTRRELIL